jgi:hypothetical protein
VLDVVVLAAKGCRPLPVNIFPVIWVHTAERNVS